MPSRRNIPLARVQQQYFPLVGGLDTETPALSLKPGKVFDSQNYESALTGGYRRIDGYERYDGRTSPSSGSYWLISCNISATISAGNTITGATSGATGRVLQVNAAELVLGRVSGTFQSGENLQVGGVTKAVATSSAGENSAQTGVLDSAYKSLAADSLRADITTVPGSGSILGVCYYNDIVYAFRNNAGGTAAALYKSSSSGWQSVSLGTEIQYTAGTGGIPAEGSTLTRGGVTATIRRVLTRTGAWSGTAAGTLVISNVSGGSFTAGAATTSGGSSLTLSGAETAITLPPGGRYEFVKYNFSASADKMRIYGCNGVGTAFEFDGTYFVPIRTGMTTDTPTHIAAHKNYLFLSFRGSLQFSGIADPFAWSVVTGAGELGIGDTITALLPQTSDASGAAMAVYAATKTFMLYGSSASDFKLSISSSDAGAAAYSAQNIGVGYVLSERGIQQLLTTITYGDFQFATVSQLVQRLIDSKAGTCTASAAIKRKNQYRVYFSDGAGVFVTLNGTKVAGIMPVSYNTETTTRPVRCYFTGESSTGLELSFFGSDDGYVFRDGIGTSFDGENIESWVRLVFDHVESPRVRKTFKRTVLEASTEGYGQIQFSYELDYGEQAAGSPETLLFSGLGGFWDQFTWDQFTWDSPSVISPSISLTGSGRNISLFFYSNRKQDAPHILQGVIFFYIPRRNER